MRDTYRQIDEQVGKVMSAVGENTAIVVMSDHGFSSFRRQVHLNRWLEQHGYLRLTDSFNRDNYEWLQGIDWSATRAFAIGLNSLYLNVRGREKQRHRLAEAARGARAEARAGARRAWVDEETGQKVITQVVAARAGLSRPVRRRRAGHHRRLRTGLPRVVGYDDRQGAADASSSRTSTNGPAITASIPARCPACCSAIVRCGRRAGGLADLTVSVLGYFGVAPAAGMNGKPMF